MRRPAEEYISHFREIRQIHDHILESALRTGGVQAVENVSIEAASDAAVAFIANRTSGMSEKARKREPSLLFDAGTPRGGVQRGGSG
jgi:2-phosphoglycerate kinase